MSESLHEVDSCNLCGIIVRGVVGVIFIWVGPFDNNVKGNVRHIIGIDGNKELFGELLFGEGEGVKEAEDDILSTDSVTKFHVPKLLISCSHDAGISVHYSHKDGDFLDVLNGRQVELVVMVITRIDVVFVCVALLELCLLTVLVDC